MRQASRRAVLALLVAALALPAAAAPKLVDPKKVFPFLEAYLKLPPAERGHFKPAYYFHVGPQPLAAPVAIVEGTQRTPLPLRDGFVVRLPTLAQVQNGQAEFSVDGATKISLSFGVEPMVPPAQEMDAQELAVSITQAAAGQKKVAGILAMAAPKLKDVTFVGVPSGEVEFADGHRAVLPLVKGAPVYNPAETPNAKKLRFPKVPTRLDIG